MRGWGEDNRASCQEQLTQGSQTVTFNHACIWIAFCFFGCAMWLVGFEFPNQWSNPSPRQWKQRVLTSGLPGKSPGLLFPFKESLAEHAG